MKIKVEKGGMEEVLADLEVVRAIQTLEYHDKNHLALDDARRSRAMICILNKAIETMEANIK